MFGGLVMGIVNRLIVKCLVWCVCRLFYLQLFGITNTNCALSPQTFFAYLSCLKFVNTTVR
jgi:hypothetical protein